MANPKLHVIYSRMTLFYRHWQYLGQVQKIDRVLEMLIYCEDIIILKLR